MQCGGLQMFQDHAAVSVHDALGRPGGAGGEQHPQRVIEIHRGHIGGDGLGDQCLVVIAVQE